MGEGGQAEQGRHGALGAEVPGEALLLQRTRTWRLHAHDETDLWVEEAHRQRPEGGNGLGPSKERQDPKVKVWGLVFGGRR